MPTAGQLEEAALKIIKNTHVGGALEWDWAGCADPEKTVYLDIAGNVFIGRKEIQPQVDAWKKGGKITHELLSPIATFPNLFGDVSLIHYKIEYTSELPALPGLPGLPTRLHSGHFLAGGR